MTQQTANSLYKSLFWGAVLTYLLAILFNLKTFQLWPQVLELHEMGLQINLKSIYMHPHALRYALVYPIFLIAEFLNVSPDLILSLAVVVMCGVISFTLSHSFAMYQKVRTLWEIKFLVFAFFALLTFMMNGRLIFGLCAYSILVYSLFLIEKHPERKYHLQASSLILVALFFSSISSGVAISLFAICFSTVFFYLISSFKRNIKFNKPLAIYMTILLLLYTPIVLCLVNKNLNYFGSGYEAVIQMTQHGTLNGISSEPNDEERGVQMFRFICAGFTIILIGFVYTYKWQLLQQPLLLFTTYCMTALLLLSSFAFSILMMGFIPAVMMLAFLISQYNIVGNHLYEGYHTSVPNNT